MRFATTVDVEETATGSTVGPAEVAWQMTAHEVRALGGLGWGGSLVLRSKSKGLSELLDGARACIPHEVIPRFDDSAVDLRCRLRDSDFLDDIHCLKGGKGPGRVRLNATCYPQPRRVTWSVVADIDRDTGAHGLYAYTQHGRSANSKLTALPLPRPAHVVERSPNPPRGSPTPHGRLPQDYRCRAMPLPVFDFGVALWRLAHPWLGAVSQQSPPPACQLMMYFAAFNPSVGQHRDNFCTQDFRDWWYSNLRCGTSVADYIQGMATGHAASADANSQRVGSDVLLYT